MPLSSLNRSMQMSSNACRSVGPQSPGAQASLAAQGIQQGAGAGVAHLRRSGIHEQSRAQKTFGLVQAKVTQPGLRRLASQLTPSGMELRCRQGKPCRHAFGCPVLMQGRFHSRGKFCHFELSLWGCTTSNSCPIKPVGNAGGLRATAPGSVGARAAARRPGRSRAAALAPLSSHHSSSSRPMASYPSGFQAAVASGS